MAKTALADIFDPIVFQDLPAVDSPEKTVFFTSGVIVRSPLLDQIASDAGKLAELPFWKDVDGSSETNYSDDSANKAVPEKVVQGEQIARKAFVNKGWSESDLSAELALGGSALQRVRNRTDSYFVRQWQRRIIASCNGILADNVASNAGDMVNSIASESIAGQSASTKWSRQAFTGAVFTMGDAQDEITAIGVHSAVYQQMIDANDVTFIPDSEGTGEIPTYLGRRVIVDDGLPVIAGTTNGLKYVSVLFGLGAFGYGEGEAKVPAEVERDGADGNGGGSETLWVRKTWLLHPFGFKTETAPAGVSYTLAELASAATWGRVVERKNVPLAFLITN